MIHMHWQGQDKSKEPKKEKQAPSWEWDDDIVTLSDGAPKPGVWLGFVRPKAITYITFIY